MFRFVARALPGKLLFVNDIEARGLWRIITRTFPEAEAICLMPNHIHLDLPHPDPDDRLTDAMSAYARWRNHRRGTRGIVWEAHPPVEIPADASHARRSLRYTLLNPCRAHLARDPLAWPWSTHRDAVGLADRPVVPLARVPDQFHAWISGDPSVDTAGTPLPRTRYAETSWGEVTDAVCAITRSFPHELQERGAPRTLALKTAWAHGLRDVRALAAGAGCEARCVQATVSGIPSRGADFADPALAACVRVVGDPRFHALTGGDLRRSRAWERTKYARMA